MIYYINVNKKRIVGRNNQISSRPLNLEYDVTEVIDFQFIDDNNQLQPLSPNTPGLTLAIGLKQNMPSYDLLALSHDYEIVNGQTLRFIVNTYTVNWLKKINKANTEVFIEISQQSLESKKVWMRDYCYVWPRVYTAGLEPEEIASNDYYTKAETDEAIENAIEGISGFVTEEQFEEGLSTKQNVIDDENKLAYELLSGTPTIPTKTSDLENDSDFVTSSDVETAISGKADKSELPTKTSDLNNDSGFITDSALVGYATETFVENAVSGKQDAITNENKLDYSLLSSTPTIPVVPTNVSDFTNDAGYQTAQDVQDAISGKADTSALTAHTSDTTIHVTSADKTAWDGKQDAITNDNKLDYSLLSGTPEVPTVEWGAISGTLSNQTDLQNALNDKANASDIPLSTSQLTNDSGFITDSALSGKQDVIDANNKLDYSLLSSTPTIPTKTSDLQNDSGFITDSSLQGLASETYVDNAVSSKIDNPSGGTVGQVLTKTTDGEEWADSQGGGGGDAKNVTIENKAKSGNAFVVDFLNGKQIQKYNIANAASESLQISIADNFSSLPSGVAPTVELQIPVVSDVSSVILPNNVQIIEMPEILSGAGGIENTYKYHDIVFRAEKDCNDIWKTYANYAYAFNEVYYPSGMPTLGLTYYMPFDSSYETPTIGNNNLTLEGTAPTLETQDGISGMTSDSGTGYLYEQGTATYWTPVTSGVPNATFSMWFKPTSWSGDILFCAGENYHSWSSENSAANLLIVASNNEMRFIVHDTTDHIHVNTYPELDKWHHYAIVFDHSLNKMSIYVDGVFINDATTSTDHKMLNVNTISFYKELGSQTLGAPAIGNIAGLRIYDRVLDATEIATLATEFTPTV